MAMSVSKCRGPASGVVLFLLGLPAGAQQPPPPGPINSAAALQTFVPGGAPESSASSSEVTTTSIEKALGPYGDPFGLRAFLKSKGIEYSFTYVGEVLGNATGGFKRGATYEGRLDGELNVDFEKLAGISGLGVHSNFYQIHGRGLSSHNLMDLFTASGIEAFPDTKLYEAWIEKQLFDGKAALAVGQFAPDADFLVSQTASLFVNSSYGWPAIYANNLPSGGPSYPFAAPGVRVRYKPNSAFTLVSALVDGDPADTSRMGVLTTPARTVDHGGASFRLQDPPLFINEAQFTYNHEKDAKGLPGTIKLGYFHQFDRFQAFDAPPGSGRTLRGNDGGYLLVDQSVYKEKDSDQGASVFLRVAGSPRDRNLIDLFVDGGISYQGLLPGRGDDTIGLSATYARISPAVAQQDVASGAAPLIRDYQALIEATYQYVVMSGFTLQPDFQYVFHPGADGVADPRDGRPLRNAAVFGLRTTIIY